MVDKQLYQAALVIVMGWLATGGADQLRQERRLIQLAAFYGMIVAIREGTFDENNWIPWLGSLGVTRFLSRQTYGPGFYEDAYPP